MAKQTAKKGLVELGLGVVSLIAVDAILNTVKKMQKEGKLNKKEGEKMIKDVTRKYRATSSKYAKDLQTNINNLMKESAKASPFASKDEIKQLNAKIEKLTAALSKHAKVPLKVVGKMAKPKKSSKKSKK